MSTSDAQAITLELSKLREDMRRLQIGGERLEWLSVKDLSQITGFSEYTIKKMRRKGDIPMFLPPGSNEWRMTRKAFEAWQRRVVEEGTPMEARFPSL